MGKLKIKNEKVKTMGIPTVFIPGLILATVLGWDWERDLGRLGKIGGYGGDGGYKRSEVIFPEKGVVNEVLLI